MALPILMLQPTFVNRWALDESSRVLEATTPGCFIEADPTHPAPAPQIRIW
jgi:hypothetical protein